MNASMNPATDAIQPRQEPERMPPGVDDVAGYLSCCSDTFSQLVAIFSCIQDAVAEDKEILPYHVRALAQAGHYIATDIENTSDCWREEVARMGVRSA